MCGPGRTGTTVLDLMLGNGNNHFSCGEVYAFFRPWRTHHRNPVCSCGNEDCSVWERFSHIRERDFHKTVSDFYNVEWIIDSSKELSWLVDTQSWCSDSNINVINLLTWKHPIDLCYSHWKRGRGINFWRNRFLIYYSKFIDLKIPFYSIFIDDLIAAPNLKIKEICDVIGMPYNEGKEKFWEKEHHYLFGSSNVRKQYYLKTNYKNVGKITHPEFTEIQKDIQDDIINDKKIQDIITILKNHEISNYVTDKIVHHEYKKPMIMPFWYYTNIITRRYKRFRPEKSQYKDISKNDV